MQRYYFDHNATTPVAREVLEAMTPAMLEDFGNASSIHYHGQRARQRLDDARRRCAALLRADMKEVVFTSGGTEADNLAIFGAVRASRREQAHVITTAIEHPAVLNSCLQLERKGVELTVVHPDSRGVVEPADIRKALRPHTVLISVMHVNSELGTVQPVAEIARLAREAGALIHSDGVQAAGRLPIDVRALDVDLYSMSGHKMYAPKGSGALYVRKGVDLEPLFFGGRHEGQRRAGTENVPGCVGLGVACELAGVGLGAEAERVAALRDRLESAVRERVPGVQVNGAGAPRVANTTNLRFDGIGSEALTIALDLKGFSVSAGSACSSGAVEPSHVLLAIGLSPQEARSSIRISLGRSTTSDQVDALVNAICDAAAHLRRLSPASLAHA